MNKLLMSSIALAGVCAAQVTLAGCCGSDGTTCKANDKDAMCPAGTCQPQAAAGVVAPKEALVNTDALAALLRTKVPVILLDARSGKYDDGRRLPGAKALSPMAKDEEVLLMLPDKNALLVTYCVNLKCPASHMLGDKLRMLGYLNVLEYHEGIDGWTAAGNAVEQPAK